MVPWSVHVLMCPFHVLDLSSLAPFIGGLRGVESQNLVASGSQCIQDYVHSYVMEIFPFRQRARQPVRHFET